MLLRFGRVASVLAVVSTLAASPGSALTISVTGASGLPGSNGAAGQPGTDGGEGEPAIAAAISPDAANSATATGGSGGAGGGGGNGTVPGQNGGDGGDGGGGAGAEATANTGTSGPASAQARAFGGVGGAGGAGGTAGTGGLTGLPGAGGHGGGATASACAVSDTGSADATLVASAGRGGGGSTAGAGGSATGTVCAESFGSSSQVIAGGNSSAVDGGGGGNASEGDGGAGGSAEGVADATAHGASGSAFARMQATGGIGGNALGTGDGGAGGDASASAVARAGNFANAVASATGGAGGAGRGVGHVGGAGGAATARAETHADNAGFATSPAAAHAFAGPGGPGGFGAHGGRGGDATLIDAVSGSSPSSISLEQRAVAGDGGETFTGGNGGDGGDAVSTGDFTNPAGGSIAVSLEALGGNGGRGDVAGSGGDARIGGTVTASEGMDAFLFGGVRAGSSATAASGVASVGPLLATTSGSGEARVDLGFETGNSGLGHGNDAAFTNAIDAVASPAGRITLRQLVTAGTSNGAGDGGDASSTLEQVRSVERLQLGVRATGGDGGNSLADGGAGGDASALARGTNDAGAVVLDGGEVGGAFGGRGAFASNGTGGQGGTARVLFEATTSGDGHAIEIGRFDPVSALGGVGGSANAGVAGAGGSADMVARGVALGDSPVTVRAEAGAGSGGSSGLGSAVGVDGANASVEAFGSNTGGEAVRVSAAAFGGTGGAASGAGSSAGNGGTGTARARGESATGSVNVFVEQLGGRGGNGAFGGGGGNGADSVLDNAATGSTAGDLHLTQVAVGGWSGSGPGRSAGDAVSRMDVAHAGTALTLEAEAAGGRTASDSGGIAGDAEIDLFGEGSGDVTLLGSAFGGLTDGTGDPGEALLTRLSGRSTGGGTVEVHGLAQGGSVVGRIPAPASAGESVVLHNAVDGETSGVLVLDQVAIGGNSPTAPGDAVSRLEKIASNASLLGRVEARGGAHGSRGTGGSATTSVDVTNRAGEATAAALSRGGVSSGFDGTAPAPGATASVEAHVTTEGDGNAVRVGIGFFETGAYGGNGGLPGAAGGLAQSLSIGTALGDSRVDVLDIARGGEGGGVGGLASSHAEGSNQGAASVEVHADAWGGQGANEFVGGNAEARAIGRSLTGDVTVTARQAVGRSGTGASGTDTEMVDAVSGSTAGRLTLLQTAIGGQSGFIVFPSDPGLDGGSARSVLRTGNDGGGDIDATVEAFGDLGNGGRGGAATVGAHVTGAAAVRLTGNAIAGRGAIGGDAVIEPLLGESTGGGDVDVVAQATGGSGGTGGGASVSLVDAVGGSTTGRLSLEQRAQGGSGDSFGVAGMAASLLERAFEGVRLALTTFATGGYLGIGDGARATASSRGRNDIGESFMWAQSSGGHSSGASGPAASARGGEADSVASAGGFAADAFAIAHAGGGGILSGDDAATLERVAGGSALGEAIGRATGGAAFANASAAGGGGGAVRSASGVESGGAGGGATATATADSASAERVGASASATGGTGGSGRGGGAGGTGGQGMATAFARSTGGGQVEVAASQTGGDGGSAQSGGGLAAAGGDSTIRDAVSGETSGRLILFQDARGGNGGFGRSGEGAAGGRAESYLDASNSLGGALEAHSAAFGGDGGLAETGGDGGAAIAGVIVTGTGASDVVATATAWGGSARGGTGGDGGVASLDTVFASSDGGGSVGVVGTVRGGSVQGGNDGGRGADAVLVDAVDGATSGVLQLEQRAIAGLGSRLGFGFGTPNPALVGIARSELRKEARVRELHLSTYAEGGDARAIVAAENPEGGASALAFAEGYEGHGAVVDAYAASAANGSAVNVGLPLDPDEPFDFPRAGAYGGNAVEGFAAGAAQSRSLGVHAGDGAVTVHDIAAGGRAGFFDGGRDGADATSEAVARNQGVSRVEAHAAAFGGSAFFGLDGDGDASAQATGQGQVLAVARGFGGAGFGADAGSSRAYAVASGESGEARAGVASSSVVAGLRADVIAQVSGGAAIAEATQASGDFRPGRFVPIAPDAFVHAARAPSSDALSLALAGNSAASAAFGRNADEILALVETGGGGDGERDIVLGSDLEFTPGFLGVASGDELLIGFLDPVLSGLKSLRIEIALGEHVRIELAFTDGTAAENFLDDRVFAFQIEPSDALSIDFEMETMAGAPRASLDFLVATVPEPRTLALLALALLALAFRTRARSPRRGGASPPG